MAKKIRVCRTCGVSIAHRANRAQYCSDSCKTVSALSRAAQVPPDPTPARPIPSAVPAPTTKKPSVSPPPDDEPGPVEIASLRELTKLQKVDTPIGQTILALARRIDYRGDTGSALASLAKQIQEALKTAQETSVTVADPIDELQALRDRKREHAV